jgi:2-alkyl-3-oxoalkanoate reductase
MKVLVTGGTGFLGRNVVRRLLTDGDEVRVLARNPGAATDLAKEGAEIVSGDLRQGRTVISACDGVDAVIHTAALSAPWGRKREFLVNNVVGTRHVLTGCKTHQVRRLIYISSPSVVFTGQDQVDLADDAPYPTRFVSMYSATKAIAEKMVSRAVTEDGLSAINLRPKAIFGPGDTSLLPRLIAAARVGRLPQIGDGTNRVDLTYVENVAHAIALALRSEKAVGGTYTITNGESVLLWEVIRRVLEHVGLSTKLKAFPVPVALAAATLMEARASITGKEPLLTRYTVQILARTQTYDISAARRDLGYEPIVPLEEGIRRTLEALDRVDG